MTIDVIETRDFAFLPIVNYGEHGLVMGFMWWRFMPKFGRKESMAEKVKERFDVFMDTLSKEMLVSLGLLEAENLLLYAKWKLRSEKYHIIRGFYRKRALKALLDYRYCESCIESISKDLLRHESSN